MTEQTTAPRPLFRVSSMATIKHLNVRKEGPDDEKILAVDVKMEMKGIDRRLCSYFDDALEAFLWRGDTDALIVRSAFLSPVVYLHTISGAQVKIGRHTYMDCEVKKFGIQPQDGGVITLICSVSLNPSASEVSDLAKLVQDEERVEIDGPPDLFASDMLTGVKAAFKELNSTLVFDGISATIESSCGEVLASLGINEPDPIYDQALEVVLKNGKPSISLVQRHLKIGYNRAARLIEQMEAEGKVSAMDGAGSRKLVAA